jgi:hypothetical protein
MIHSNSVHYEMSMNTLNVMRVGRQSIHQWDHFEERYQ